MKQFLWLFSSSAHFFNGTQESETKPYKNLPLSMTSTLTNNTEVLVERCSPYLSANELLLLSLVNVQWSQAIELVYQVMFRDTFGKPMFTPRSWRKIFVFRRFFQCRKANVEQKISGRCYFLSDYALPTCASMKETKDTSTCASMKETKVTSTCASMKETKVTSSKSTSVLIAENNICSIPEAKDEMECVSITKSFDLARGQTMVSSSERALIYSRCKKMFQLSMELHRSIHLISSLVDRNQLSISAARALVQEHTSLMAAVGLLRKSLLFESELFPLFPAPMLIDRNTILTGNFKLNTKEETNSLTQFIDNSKNGVMQLWVSLDNIEFRPLSVPFSVSKNSMGKNNRDEIEEANVEPVFSTVKFHEYSDFVNQQIDDNSIRYQFNDDYLCVNALISTTYMLYLFNPVKYNPLDWEYLAVIECNGKIHELPIQRERIFLNDSSASLRIYLIYGGISLNPDKIAGRPLGIDIPDKECIKAEIYASNRVNKCKKRIMNATTNERCEKQQDGHIEWQEKVRSRDSLLTFHSFPKNTLQSFEFSIGLESLFTLLDISSFTIPDQMS